MPPSPRPYRAHLWLWIFFFAVAVVAILEIDFQYGFRPHIARENVSCGGGDCASSSTNPQSSGSTSSQSSALPLPLSQRTRLYTNPTLEFSLLIPTYVSSRQCTGDPSLTNTPVKTIEDGDVTYITPAVIGTYTQHQDGTQSCTDTPITLDAIQKNGFMMDRLWYEDGWKMVAMNHIGSDTDLLSFVRTWYGSGCGIEEKNPTDQSGTYDVVILGDTSDAAAEHSACPLNFIYALKYSPSKEEAVTWRTGQDGYFDDLDADMMRSFRFINGTSSGASMSDGAGAIQMLRHTSDEDVLRSSFPLDASGTQNIHSFLQKAGLTDVEPVVSGASPFTNALCQKLYQIYNVQHASQPLSDVACPHNLAPDGNTYEENGSPIVLRVSEFDHRYLFLFVSEEGLGGATLFLSTYDMQTGRIGNIDPASIGTITDVGLDADTLSFYQFPFESPDPPILLATYDLQTQTLTRKNAGF